MKKRTWIFLILYTVAVLWSGLAFAQTPPPTPPNQQTPAALSLTPPDTDYSVGYLSNIFGTVDGVLSGTGSQLLGSMFGIFNGAILVLGGIVILYTLFIGTIKTAHEGEALGKQWSSVWIPLRSVMAIALLIPKATGYSFIQIFMLWVVVMGIGAADSIWSAALNFFQGGGIIMKQNTALNQIGGGGKLLSGAGSLLRMLTCTEMLQNQLQAYQNQTNPQNPAQVPNFYNGIQTSIASQLNSSPATISFPGGSYGNICGTITWTAPSTSAPGVNQQNQQQIQQSRALAVQAMVTNLYGPAVQIVNNALVANPATNRFELGHILSTTGPAGGGAAGMIWGGGTAQQQTPFLLAGSTLSNAASSYFGIMSPTLNLLNNYKTIQTNLGNWISSAQAYGWILAGSYYWQVININQSAGGITETAPPTFDASSLIGLSSKVAGYFSGGANSTYAQNIDGIVNGSGNYQVSANGTFISDSITYGTSLTYGAIAPGTIGGSGSGVSAGGAAGSILAMVTGPIGPLFDSFYSLATVQGTPSTNNANNPVFLLASLGSTMVNMVCNIYVGIAAGMLVLGAFLAFWFGFAAVVLMIAVLLPILALFTPILMAMMAAGLVMALYIPIIPLIIFTMTAIGWFISVIEAVIAAPLVALGIAHPEGQEILGKAEPAVMLLVNVFLRPTLMIFGLLIGMMLSYVGIWLLNSGFWGAYQNVQTLTSGGYMAMFSGFAAIIIYTGLVTAIVQKSFALIYMIPDEVMEWIGHQARDKGGAAEAEKTIAGSAQGAAEAGAKATTGAVEAGATSVKSGIEEGGKAGYISPESMNTGAANAPPPSVGGSKPPGGGGSSGASGSGSGGAGAAGGASIGAAPPTPGMGSGGGGGTPPAV